MERKKSILYVYPGISSFIQSDIDNLSRTYNIVENTYNWTNKLMVPFLILSQFFFLLFNIKKYKCVIVSFAGYWSLAPVVCGKLFKTPVYIILNGTDCSSIPKLNYGSLRKPIHKKVIEYCCRKSKNLLPVSNSLIYTTNTFDESLPKNQGIRYYFPTINTPIKVIANGFDTDFWDAKEEKVANLFLSVFSESQFFLKGGDLIVEVAKKQPENNFVVVGCPTPNIDVPSNLIFKGFLTPPELKKMYSKAKYYLQLSSFEGFGCSLAEAMLCGCIPIVSNVNSMPEIIGEYGYLLTRRDSDLLSSLLIEITLKNTITSEMVRNRIKQNYPISKRMEEIKMLIEN